MIPPYVVTDRGLSRRGAIIIGIFISILVALLIFSPRQSGVKQEMVQRTWQECERTGGEYVYFRWRGYACIGGNPYLPQERDDALREAMDPANHLAEHEARQLLERR